MVDEWWRHISTWSDLTSEECQQQKSYEKSIHSIIKMMGRVLITVIHYENAHICHMHPLSRKKQQQSVGCLPYPGAFAIRKRCQPTVSGLVECGSAIEIAAVLWPLLWTPFCQERSNGDLCLLEMCPPCNAVCEQYGSDRRNSRAASGSAFCFGNKNVNLEAAFMCGQGRTFRCFPGSRPLNWRVQKRMTTELPQHWVTWQRDSRETTNQNRD